MSNLDFRHKAFYGMTGMGKTWCMKRIAKKLRQYKQKVIVYSGVGDINWPAGCKTCYDVDHLEALLADKNNFGAHVFLDEGSILYCDYKPSKHKNIHNAFIAGRHKGYTFYIATQFPTSIPPRVRVNCSELFCFRLGAEEHAKLVRKDFGDIKYQGKFIDTQILNLNKLEFFHIVQPHIVKKAKL